MRLLSVRQSRGRSPDSGRQLLSMQLYGPKENGQSWRGRGHLCDLSRGRRRDAIFRSARLHEEKGFHFFPTLYLPSPSFLFVTYLIKYERNAR